MRYEDVETIKRETSDGQTIRLQTGSAPWNVYSTYDRNLVQGDFSTPLRFARNDGAFCCATVEVLHRTSKWGEVRRLACPLRRFPFAAPPNCGRKGGTQYQKGETAQAVRRSGNQTSDGPFGPFVGGLYNHRGPPLLVKSYNRAFGAKGKHADQAAPVGNAPLSPLRGTSTRREKFALHSVFALISNARHSAGKSAPSGGKVVR